MLTLALDSTFGVLFTKSNRSAFCGALILGITAVSLPMIAPAAPIAVAEQIVVQAGDWWQEVPSPFTNTKELIGGRAPDGTIQARASITTIKHSSDEAALARLQREAKLGENAHALQISGRPAVRLTDQVELEKRAQNLPPVVSQSQQITTLIAIDNLVLKITVTLANKAEPDSLKKALEFASLTHISTVLPPTKLDSALADLEKAIATKRRNLTSPLFFSNATTPLLAPLTSRSTESNTPVLAAQRGELEVAVSNDGTDVVIGTNSGTVFSNDGGVSWSTNQTLPNENLVGVNFQRRGDPSVGRAPSGRFFLSYLGREGRSGGICKAAGADCRDTVSVAISEPANRGANFSFRSNAAVCDPGADPFGTDQPHLVMARQPSALDREVVYVVWRRSVPNDAEASASCAALGTAHFVTQLSCSQDGGQTWAHSIKIDDRGRHPRIGISRNGKPYVIAVRSSGGGAIDLTRVSSCPDGLVIEEDFPVVADTFDGVACPVAGLDRCNFGNTLASPTVSPSPERELSVFVSFATRTADGNENIVVRASEDGGLTWVSTIANDRMHQARRFMPWSCAVSEGVYVGWYDREVATATNNDLTRYQGAFLEYRPDNILATTEFLKLFRAVDLSRGIADPQCSLWPSSPRNIGDSENCSRQPQLAGLVPGADGTCDAPGPDRCDFSDSATANPSLNCCLGLGSPKYGDYNGIACAGQRAFVAWASATAPAHVPAPPANSIGTYFAVLDHAETTTTLCPGSGEACINLGRGHLDFQCPEELCDIRVPVPKLCEKVINCPICDSNWQCTGTDAFVLQGLPPESGVKLVDEHGRVLQKASSVGGSTQRVQSLRKIFGSEQGARALTLEFRGKLAEGEGGKQSVKITGER
jgi:hypothetical protein